MPQYKRIQQLEETTDLMPDDYFPIDRQDTPETLKIQAKNLLGNYLEKPDLEIVEPTRTWARRGGKWIEIFPDEYVLEANIDNKAYVRKNGDWEEIGEDGLQGDMYAFTYDELSQRTDIYNTINNFSGQKNLLETTLLSGHSAIYGNFLDGKVIFRQAVETYNYIDAPESFKNIEKVELFVSKNDIFQNKSFGLGMYKDSQNRINSIKFGDSTFKSLFCVPIEENQEICLYNIGEDEIVFRFVETTQSNKYENDLSVIVDGLEKREFVIKSQQKVNITFQKTCNVGFEFAFGITNSGGDFIVDNSYGQSIFKSAYDRYKIPILCSLDNNIEVNTYNLTGSINKENPLKIDFLSGSASRSANVIKLDISNFIVEDSNSGIVTLSAELPDKSYDWYQLLDYTMVDTLTLSEENTYCIVQKNGKNYLKINIAKALYDAKNLVIDVYVGEKQTFNFLPLEVKDGSCSIVCRTTYSTKDFGYGNIFIRQNRIFDYFINVEGGTVTGDFQVNGTTTLNGLTKVKTLEFDNGIIDSTQQQGLKLRDKASSGNIVIGPQTNIASNSSIVIQSPVATVSTNNGTIGLSNGKTSISTPELQLSSKNLLADAERFTAQTYDKSNNVTSYTSINNSSVINNVKRSDGSYNTLTLLNTGDFTLGTLGKSHISKAGTQNMSIYDTDGLTITAPVYNSSHRSSVTIYSPSISLSWGTGNISLGANGCSFSGAGTLTMSPTSLAINTSQITVSTGSFKVNNSDVLTENAFTVNSSNTPVQKNWNPQVPTTDYGNTKSIVNQQYINNYAAIRDGNKLIELGETPKLNNYQIVNSSIKDITVTGIQNNRAVVVGLNNELTTSNVTINELNTLQGINTGISLQSQLDAIPKYNYLNGITLVVTDDIITSELVPGQSIDNETDVWDAVNQYTLKKLNLGELTSGIALKQWDAISIRQERQGYETFRDAMYFYDEKNKWSFLYYLSTTVNRADKAIAGVVESSPDITFTDGYGTVNKLTPGRNIKIGNATKKFDGSADISYSYSEMGVVPQTEYTLTSFTKSLTLTTDWQDTGISFDNLQSGSYVVQVSGINSTVTNFWNEIWTGFMSWYGSGTNDSDSDEIVLHKAGHASNTKTIFLRTIRSRYGTGTNLRLQIACTNTFSSATNITFKFRKLI